MEICFILSPECIAISLLVLSYVLGLFMVRYWLPSEVRNEPFIAGVVWVASPLTLPMVLIIYAFIGIGMLLICGKRNRW